MNAQFRDVRFIVPFFIQAMLFITPFALLDEPAQRRRYLDIFHNYRQLPIYLPNF
jgi:ABC-type polysaccharide/polyol phosphate export permease